MNIIHDSPIMSRLLSIRKRNAPIESERDIIKGSASHYLLTLILPFYTSHTSIYA